MKIINKIIATVVVIMMMLFNSMAFAVEVTNGTVNTETLRLRKEPSTDSIVLELLSKDDKVEILEEKDEWYKVKFNDYTGYVSKEFISKTGEVKSSEVKNENNENNENKNENTTKNETQETKTEGTVEVKDKKAVTNVEVKVYILPLVNSNVVKKLEKNTDVKIVNVAGGWAYVNVNEVNGWIRLDKLSISDSKDEKDNSKSNTENVESTSQTDKQTNFTEKTAYVNASSVNVRSGASTDTQVVTTLLQNTEVKLVGEEDGWYKVVVNGKNGYISKSLVSDTKVEVTSRSTEPTRNTTKTNTNTNNTTTTTTTNTQSTNKTTNTQETKSQEQSSQNAAITQTLSSKGEEVIAYAKQLLGKPYVYGGSGPNVFDCSGFTMYVYKHFGYSMGHSAVTQASVGTYVPKSNLKPGDLIIFNNESNTSIGHVGMYVGGGNFIHASSGSGRIVIASLSNGYFSARYVTARRIFN